MKALFASRGISKFFVTVDNIQYARQVADAIRTPLGSADVITNEASIELAISSLQMIGSTALYSSLSFFRVSALLIIFVKILVFREQLREVAILEAPGTFSGKER